jgi:hypothetical protein
MNIIFMSVLEQIGASLGIPANKVLERLDRWLNGDLRQEPVLFFQVSSEHSALSRKGRNEIECHDRRKKPTYR